MPIVASDLIECFSGGASNTDPNAALGGARSTVNPAGRVTDNTTHNLWDVVSSAQSSAGSTEYRCIYLLNNHATLALQNAKVWISTNTASADTEIRIGVGTSAVNGTEQTIPNETNNGSDPSGVTFSLAATEGAALSLGASIPAGQHKAIWIKRIVTAGATAANDDSYVLSYAGDTAA